MSTELKDLGEKIIQKNRELKELHKNNNNSEKVRKTKKELENLLFRYYKLKSKIECENLTNPF